MTDYEQGFMDKCAELGVDPVKLAGFGDFIMGGPLGAVSRGAYDLGRGIHRGAQYLASIPGQVGERIGNNYARWAAENPAPPSPAKQRERELMSRGYMTRTLNNYRRAAGVDPSKVPQPAWASQSAAKQPQSAPSPLANAWRRSSLLGQLMGGAK